MSEDTKNAYKLIGGLIIAGLCFYVLCYTGIVGAIPMALIGWIAIKIINGNKREDEQTQNNEDVRCPHCNGTGIVNCEPCPHCHGTGIVHEEEKAE